MATRSSNAVGWMAEKSGVTYDFRMGFLVEFHFDFTLFTYHSFVYLQYWQYLSISCTWYYSTIVGTFEAKKS